jgi:hypothetical protein
MTAFYTPEASVFAKSVLKQMHESLNNSLFYQLQSDLLSVHEIKKQEDTIRILKIPDEIRYHPGSIIREEFTERPFLRKLGKPYKKPELTMADIRSMWVHDGIDALGTKEHRVLMANQRERDFKTRPMAKVNGFKFKYCGPVRNDAAVLEGSG